MATAKGTRSGRAYVEIGTEDSALIAGLKRAQAKLQAFGAAVRAAGIGLTGIGGAIAAPILAAARGFAAGGAAALDMANRTGLSVEAIGELGYAARQNGADLGELEVGIKRMQKTIVEAAKGGGAAKDALAALGLTAQQLMELKPEDQFQLIADRLSAIKDPTVKAAAAVALFGRSGTRLLPMVGQLGTLRAEARRIGAVMTTEDARAAHALEDAFTALTVAFGAAQRSLGRAVAPVLTRVLRAMSEGLATIRLWIRAHSELVVLGFQLGASLVVAGTAVIGLGFAFTGLAKALNVVMAPVRVAGMLVGLLSGVLSGLLSPLGLAAVAVAGLGAAVLIYTDVGAKALAWLGDTFAWLRDSIGTVIQGITDALTAGDITTAAEVLWAALRLAWIAGTAKLNEIWLSAENWAVTQSIDMWAGLRDAFEFTVDAMARVWLAFTYGMRSAWVSFTAWHKRAIEGMANFLAKAWVEIESVFDPSINLEAAEESIDRQSAQRLHEIETERQSAINELTRQQAETQRTADAEHLAQLRKVEQEAQKAKEALDAATTPQTEEAQAALEEARQRLAEALASARQAREAAEINAPPGSANRNPGDLGALVADKMSALGTFNASAVWGLATTPLSEVARNTAITNQHLERIEKKNAPGLVFGTA